MRYSEQEVIRALVEMQNAQARTPNRALRVIGYVLSGGVIGAALGAALAATQVPINADAYQSLGPMYAFFFGVGGAAVGGVCYMLPCRR